MNEERREFEEWLPQYHRQQERQDQAIASLSEKVSSLATSVETLIKNQESMFSKINRPFQWPVLIASIALILSFVTVLIRPMDRELTAQALFDSEVITHRIEDAYRHGQTGCNIEWLKNLEQRADDRIHEYSLFD